MGLLKMPEFDFKGKTFNIDFKKELKKAEAMGVFEKAKNGDAVALSKLDARDIKEDIIFQDEKFTKLKVRIDKQTKKTGQADKFLYLYRLGYLEQLLGLTREQLLTDMINTLNRCGKAYTARFYGFNSSHQFNWLDIVGCIAQGRAFSPYLNKTVRVFPNSPQQIKDREFVKFIYEIKPECYRKISTPKGWRVEKFPELVAMKDWIDTERVKSDKTNN